MTYLAIDFGAKRTGIAVSDAGGSMAFVRPAVVKTTKEAFWNAILAAIAENNAEAVVVGMPRIADGNKTLIVRQIENFIASLQRRCALPVYCMDETLSSFEAHTLLREGGKNGIRARASLDSAAAVRILESFLALPHEQRKRI
jgi:RNAse H-fold protein YqgF